METTAERDAMIEQRRINSDALDSIIEQAITKLNETFNADIHAKHYLRRILKREIADALRNKLRNPINI